MSFKDGIPLLTAFEDEDSTEDDFTISTLPHSPRKVNKRHVCFCLVLVGALCLLLALVVGVAVPVALLRQGGGGDHSDTSSTVPPGSHTPLPNSDSISSTPSLMTQLTSSTSSKQTSQATPTPSPAPFSSVPSAMVTSSQTTPTPTRSSAHLSSVAPSPTPTPINFYQSKSDQRSYGFIQLPNMLRVLLISDPNTTSAAAAMDVGAGSFDNPIEFQGLAHFLEHMLFLGTEKFPGDDEYSEYLKQHGGYDNAYTSSENTNYYLKVQSEFLEQSLDRLSQFFISPLLNQSLVDKEVNAVNSEHEKNLLSDGWRLYQLIKEVSNPEHPFHQFSTGSLETLDRPGLWENVSSFYHTMYSANRMQLVVYGREDLSTLQTWAQQYFRNITNQDLPRPQYNSTSFGAPYNSRIIYYYPVANYSSVSVLWQLPSQEGKYRNDMSGFINRYLCQESSSSLALYLKTRGLVTGLSCYVETETETYTLLEVDLELTDDGLSCASHVIQAVYAYIDLLRGLNETEFVTRFRDYKSIQQTVFDYGQQDTAQDLTSDTAARMRTVVDPEDFLGSPARLHPNHNLFMTLLDAMTPDNSNVFLTTQQLNIAPDVANISGLHSTDRPTLDPGNTFPWPEELTRYEPVYKSPYDLRNFTEDLVQYWASVTHSEYPELGLPDCNEYVVPGDLVVMEKDDPSLIIPTLVGDDEKLAVWWLQDTGDFPQPRVDFVCQLITADAQPSLEREAKTSLFVEWVNAELSARLYSAQEVGLSFSLASLPRGISLSVSGFSEHQNMRSILTSLSNTMMLGNMTSGLFNITKQLIMDQLANYNYTNVPFRYATRYIQRVIMERPFWKHWQVLEALSNLTVADIESFSKTLLSNLSVDCFAHGNINQTQALSYADVLKQALSSSLSGHVTPEGYSPRRIQLDKGDRVAVVIKTLNPSDQNSIVHNMFQIGELCSVDQTTSNCSRQSLLDRLHLYLLDQVISNECFHTLRTVQQLGYVAQCYSTNHQGIGSFQVLVQSQAFNSSVVYDRIKCFLSNYYNSTLSQPTFDKQWGDEVMVLRTSLSDKDSTLSDRTDRYWSLVSSGLEQFDYRLQMLDILDENSTDFTVETLRQFYRDNILIAESTKELLTVIYGQDKPFTNPGGYKNVDYQQLNQTSLHLP